MPETQGKLNFEQSVAIAMSAKKLARKNSRKRRKILLIELFVDFCKNTTLHGLKYVNERGVSIAEKIFWLLTFIVSVGLCFFLIRNVWIKWKTAPVIVSFGEQMVPVGMVPFPSVTICPQIKSQQTKYKYAKRFEKYIEEWEPHIMDAIANGSKINPKIKNMADKLLDVALLCHFGAWTNKYEREKGNESIVQHLLEVSPTVNEVLDFCAFRGKVYPCEAMFNRVLTMEGVCYNFNSLSEHEIFNMHNIQRKYPYLDARIQSQGWSFDEGYIKSHRHPYPRRGRENGAHPDLDVILKMTPEDQDGVCNSLNHGYKIYVQHPADLPQASLYYYAALSNQVSSLALKFSMLTTLASLIDYSPEVRQCYFPKDRELQYFKMYTQNNCRLECAADYVFRQCKCVWYNMPHKDSRNICTIDKKDCVIRARDELADREMLASVGSKSDACHCLPACNSVNYDAEILKTDFDLSNYKKNIQRMNDTVPIKDSHLYSKIEMYFKEPHFVSIRRSELFGVTDFLANIGGLLGLFLGFSFLSLVEILYFITLRFCCILKRDMEQTQANTPH